MTVTHIKLQQGFPNKVTVFSFAEIQPKSWKNYGISLFLGNVNTFLKKFKYFFADNEILNSLNYGRGIIRTLH